MNRLEISAQVLECEPLRHTPAGVPALEMLLRHESIVTEAGLERRLDMTISAVALGDLARMLASTQPGSALHIEGFMAPVRKDSVKLRLHMQRVRVMDPGSSPPVA